MRPAVAAVLKIGSWLFQKGRVLRKPDGTEEVIPMGTLRSKTVLACLAGIVYAAANFDYSLLDFENLDQTWTAGKALVGEITPYVAALWFRITATHPTTGPA